MLTAIFASLSVALTLVVVGMILEPLESIKKDQPDYYKSFEFTLSPFSPFWYIALTIFLVFAEYKKNVKCSSTVGKLGKVRPFAILQLIAIIMTGATFFYDWNLWNNY